MPYIGTDINYGNLAKMTSVGDGSDVTPIATLDYTVPSSESILVFLNGVCQVPTTDFVVSGGTILTFSTPPASGVAILVMFLGRSLDIGTPADNTVGLAQLAGGTDGNLITYDASGDPANVSTGTATHVLTSNGAGAAPTFQAASGGDLRNFILDGDMQVFPEGYKTSITHNTYASSLFTFLHVGAGVIDCTQSTDVPTVGESSHTSGESLFYDITTADASMAASDLYAIRYKMTACDFGYLHQQEATLSFWVKSTKTGTHCVFFNNSAVDRSYVSEYTVSSTNTWERKTVTLTFDTSGTWLTTGEANIGLYLGWAIAGGTDRHGTNNTWQAGQKYMTSSQVNGLDSTSNDFRISQVMLTLGSSAPSTFLGESIGTVLNQVAYYVKPIFSGEVTHNVNTTMSDMAISHNPPMRVAPSYTHKDTTGTAWEGMGAGAVVQSSGTGVLNTNITNTKYGSTIFTAAWVGLTYKAGMQINNGTTLFGILDARH